MIMKKSYMGHFTSTPNPQIFASQVVSPMNIKGEEKDQSVCVYLRSFTLLAKDVLHHFSQNAAICRQHKNNLNAIFFLKLYRTHFVFLCHKDATDLKKNKKQLEENPKNTTKKNKI